MEKTEMPLGGQIDLSYCENGDVHIHVEVGWDEVGIRIPYEDALKLAESIEVGALITIN